MNKTHRKSRENGKITKENLIPQSFILNRVFLHVYKATKEKIGY